MLPQRISFQPSVGRSIPSDLLRAMPGHWQLRELAGAYVNGNGRCLNVSSEPARCNRPASNASSSRTEHRERRMTEKGFRLRLNVDETFRPRSKACWSWSYGSGPRCGRRIDETG